MNMNLKEARPQGPPHLAWNLVGARPQQHVPHVVTSLNSTPLMTVQVKPVVAATEDHGEEAGRKKKKKLSKSERLAKREQKALKQIYGPKDAHVSLISAADLRKFQQGSSSTTAKTLKKAEFFQEDFPSIDGFSSASPATAGVNASRGSAASIRLRQVPLEDFPALGAAEAELVEEPASPETPLDEPVTVLVEERLENADDPPPAALGDPVELEAPKLEASVAISGKKKSKKPIVIALDALLSQAKENEKTKEKPVSKVAAPKALPKMTVGNLLDSTGPVLINRGKIRETPKNKKPTKLKKVILASRASRQSNGNQGTVEIVHDEDSTQESSKRGPEREDEDVQDSDELNILEEEGELDKVDINSVVATAVASSVHNEVLIQLLNLALSEQTKVEVPDKADSKDVESARHPEEFLKRIKSTMHSRKFRPYCDMYLSKELHGHVIALLKELHRFQDRLYRTDLLKYRLKRRYVHGIKNVISYLQISKVVLVIMAPDIEPSAEPGGLDDQISAILCLAKERNVPVVFSGNRYILGKPIFIKTPVSSIAVLNKSGADEIFKTLVEQAEVQRTKYQEDFLQRVRTEASIVNGS